MDSFIYHRLPEKKKIWKLTIKDEFEIDLDSLDLEQHKGFIFSPYSNSLKTLLFTIKSKEEVEETNNTEPIFNKKHHFLQKEEYTNKVKKAITSIKSNELDKVVLAHEFIVPFYENPLLLFHKMCALYPHGYVYYINSKNHAWIGVSPEMLCCYSNGEGNTVALAGTQDKKSKAWGLKEKKEQEFIQTYIEQELNSIKGLSLEKGDTRTIRAGEIEHISSIYNFKTDYIGLSQVVKNLHPTPAVCGFPKQKAMEFIVKEEGIKRTFYSGFLGLNETNKTNLFVNLRCAQFIGNNLHLYAGAGITKDSIPEMEWEELLKKIDTILGL